MKKLLILFNLIFLLSAAGANAQTRKSIGAAEVNETFRSDFGGGYQGGCNQIRQTRRDSS